MRQRQGSGKRQRRRIVKKYDDQDDISERVKTLERTWWIVGICGLLYILGMILSA